MIERFKCSTGAGALVLTAMMLAACSSSPSTFGERLEAQGSATAELGETWNKGDEMIREGRELVADGKSEVSDGQGKISRGESMIAEGENMRRLAEQTYQQRFPAAPVPTAY